MRSKWTYSPKSEQVIDQENLIKFVKELTRKVTDVLDEGWQTSSKKEEFIKGLKQVIQQTVLRDYKRKLKINDFPKYLNRLVDIIIKRF